MKTPSILLFALVGLLCASSFVFAPAAAADTPPLLPRTAEPPAVDGDLADACWKNSLLLVNFTQPQSTAAPAQKIEARLCFDDKALYIAMTCFESVPAQIRADRKTDRGDVWQDDCVEIFLRAVGNASEYDQFIVNTLSVKQTVRIHPPEPAVPGNPNTPAHASLKTTWIAQAKVLADRWVCEIAIPFDNLGLKNPPAPGDRIEMKLGREDHAGGAIAMGGQKTALATWPPRSRYAHAEDFAPVYFETTNRLKNPTLLESGPKGFTHWALDKQPADGPLFMPDPPAPAAAPIIRFDTPGHYVTLSQSLKVAPGQLYRLTCETKGTGGGYLRARVKLDPNEKNSRALTLELAPSPDWIRHELAVPGGLDGECLIILATTENHPKGALLLRNLAFTLESAPPFQGPAIPVPVNTVEPFVIEALRVTDCRSLRGFIGAPIDGTVNSLAWNAGFWEYNRPAAGQGVGYFYRNSDGLHITFADDKGIQAIQIHGGIKADVFAGCTQYDDPASGTPVTAFPGHTEHSLAFFDKPVFTDKLSFFHVSDGYIADVNFFRAGAQATTQAKDLGMPVNYAAMYLAKISPDADPWLAKRYPQGRHIRFVGIDPTSPALKAPLGGPYDLTSEISEHHLVGPFEAETSISAVGLWAEITDCVAGTLLQIQVQDPLAPRTALTTVVVALAGPGDLKLVLDIPDQIIPSGKTLWLTVSTPSGKLSLRKFHGITLYTTPREKALPQSLAYRLTKLKGFYAAMSEARPWNGLYSKITDIDDWIDENKTYAVQLREIRDAIEYCHALDPQNETARQYYEWFYRNNKKPALPPAILPDTPETKGAPEWAVAARAAWLTAREVPAWWLDNRAVPTGELGGVVGDDTDQFGNYADFPMFENDGVAARLLDCAERLAETAEQTTLEKGLNKITMDPLHAYEEGLNHESQMVWWHYGDPVYFERCLVAAKSLENLTTVNAAGHRHFKNQDCGAQDLNFDRPLGVDGFAHNLMLHPMFEVVWYNQNMRSMKFLREWGDAWLAHQKSGPPAQYAGEVDVATDQPVASSLSTEPFASGYGGQQSAFMFLHQVSGDPKYLTPVRDFLTTTANPGGWNRCLPELQHRGFLDGLPPAAPPLETHSPMLKYLRTGDKKPLIEALKKDVAEIQHFRHMYTTAEPFTDRVFLYAISNAAVAYTGGFATRNKFNHTHAVSYEGFGTDYAALVRTARKDKLALILYNFKAEPLAGTLRIWTLEHGQYKIIQGVDGDGDDQADAAPAPGESLRQLARFSPVPITLPPRTVTTLEITQIKRLEPIEYRADLALAAREIKIATDGTISAVAHNIGTFDVPAATVFLLDPEGRIQASRKLGLIAAPRDLEPQRKPFTLKLGVLEHAAKPAQDPALDPGAAPGDGGGIAEPPKPPPPVLPQDHRGWTVQIDPGPLVAPMSQGEFGTPLPAGSPTPEITEANNVVPLP